MIKTFLELIDLTKVTKTFNYPSMIRISSLVSQLLSEVKSYYYNAHRYVNRPNLLVSLIESLEIDLTKDPEEVYTYLDATGVYVANTLGIITSVNRNEKPFKNVATNATEYFVIIDSTFQASDKMSLIEPIKCLYHTIYDFYLTHPKEYKNNTIYDYYIYGIDIKKLGLSYYYWAKSQLVIDNDIDPARFVYSIVLTEMIPRIFEIASLNLFLHYYTFGTKIKYKNYNVFDLPNYTNYIYKVFEYKKHLLKQSRLNYPTILFNLPTFIFINTFDLLFIPEGYFNKRDSWIIEASRLPYLNFLLREFNYKEDRDIITEFKKQFNYDKRNKYYDFKNETTIELIKPVFNKTEKLLKRI